MEDEMFSALALELRQNLDDLRVNLYKIYLFRLTFFKAPFQAVTDGEASLCQEVIQYFGGEGLSQRLKTC